MKGDTLVTVEENVVQQDQRIASWRAYFSSGQVDLATGTWEIPGSKAEVSFENAVASLRANSRAAVRSDPTTNQQEITVDTGSAELNRGGEHLDIGQWERASFPTGGAITKSQVLAPPQLDQADQSCSRHRRRSQTRSDSFFMEAGNHGEVLRIAGQHDVHVQHMVMEKKTVGYQRGTSPALTPGDYFWRVRAIDEKNNIERRRAIRTNSRWSSQGKEQEMLLEVDDTELHGNVVEVIGRTEPGAALIINGEQVADIRPDGHFRYFTRADGARQPYDRDHWPKSARWNSYQKSGCRGAIDAV